MNLPRIWCGTEGNAMVWDKGLDPLVVPTRWDLLGVALGGALVWLCGVGAIEGAGITGSISDSSI